MLNAIADKLLARTAALEECAALLEDIDRGLERSHDHWDLGMDCRVQAQRARQALETREGI
jgi:hypothetical protein